MRFSNGNFLISVKYVFSNKNSNEENGGIDFFLSTCLKVINKHSPCKEKYMQGNQRPFMNNHVSKKIMKRSQLRNKFLKTRNDAAKFHYNKQRNFCVSLIQKEKTKYFTNLNIKDVSDNKNFGKPLNPVSHISLKILKE